MGMMTIGPVILACAALSGPPTSSRSPELASPPYRVEFEDEQVRVLRLAVAAGQTGTAIEHLDGVLIFLTTDLRGRMPEAEALWQPAGTLALDNEGSGRFEAILVELKAGPFSFDTGLPPETNPTPYRPHGTWSSDDVGIAPYDVRFSRLLDNSRVAVTKQRFGPTAFVDALHFHTRDHLFVYLGRGEVTGATPRWNRHRVERGQVDVLPPNVLHLFSNIGSEPIEFISIHPK